MGSWHTCGSCWWSCGSAGGQGERGEVVPGQTILQGASLPAAATQSGSLFPSPARAGLPGRQGRSRNHHSESKGWIRNFVCGCQDLDSNDNLARVKEREDRILGVFEQEVYPVLETPVPDCSPRN